MFSLECHYILFYRNKTKKELNLVKKNNMKITIICILIMFSSFALIAQNDTIPPRMKYNINYRIYISHNRENPRKANGDKYSGVVQFEFVVTQKGCIDSISIISSPHESLSKETIRVLEKTDCNWICGSINGEPSAIKIKSKTVFTME